jgi:phage portal protein BeeE
VVGVGLLERIAAGRGERRMGVDQWISDYLIPSQFNYNGVSYPLGQTRQIYGQRVQQIASTLPAYMAALRASPPAFAAQMVRGLVLSQMRFTWRNPPSHPVTPRRTFGNRELAVLERPWPHATTGDLVTTMEWHEGLTGNAFVTRQPNRVRVLRPDWCGLIFGSDVDPDLASTAIDGELVGLVYQNGGLGGPGSVSTLLPDEFAHWAPIPDPECPGVGQSWISAALRDIQGDQAATQHKLQFFTNGATPNMVVKGIPAVSQEQFDAYVDMLESKHAGVANAYKTLYLTAGADATVVGSDLKQLEFKATQGAGETRIAMLGRVPAALLGISEGLAGSSLNAGNFGMARRIFADSWIYPSLQDLASSVEAILTRPTNRFGDPDAELWFDTGDMPILREDAKDAAEITEIQARTISGLVKEGFTPESAKAAVIGQDMTLLVHSGLISVQLQPPGVAAATAALPNGNRPALPAGKGA